jgi:hypothetical protein
MRRSDSMFLSSIATTLPAETPELEAARPEATRPNVSSGSSRVRRMPLIKKRLKLIARRLMRELGSQRNEAAFLLQGKEMAWRAASVPINTRFLDAGFKVFSQWDEDGIIQYLINKIPIEHETFIEFGVENYEESNTRFLMINNHWQGMVLDGCSADIEWIRKDRMYWQYDLQAKTAWITRENIDALLGESGFPQDVGLLSVDIDGNDYWIWEAIQSIRPRIVIVEYNSIFKLAPVAVPYRDDFNRTLAHHSNLYYGSSLAALQFLAKKKGYILAGSNSWGHNAFFIRSDIAGEFKSLEPEEAYVTSKFRESRDRSGKLTYARDAERLKLIEHMPVVNVVTGEMGSLKSFVNAGNASELNSEIS